MRAHLPRMQALHLGKLAQGYWCTETAPVVAHRPLSVGFITQALGSLIVMMTNRSIIHLCHDDSDDDYFCSHTADKQLLLTKLCRDDAIFILDENLRYLSVNASYRAYHRL